MSRAYYNEFDPFAAAWLRELISAGLIAPGDVDERSIVDVQPNDLEGYTQCHFFAGIGGWSVALRMAGWGDDRPIWTGSCPCQPYSVAGKQKGNADERDLWPDFYRLIRECGPAIVFGEQVADAIRHGWLDRVCDDLEGSGYACGSSVLPACGVPTETVEIQEMWQTEGETDPHFESHHRTVGPPHIRHRLWWGAVRVSDAGRGRFCIGDGFDVGEASRGMQSSTREQRIRLDAGDGVAALRLPHSGSERCNGRSRQQGSGRDAGIGGETVGNAGDNHSSTLRLQHAASDGREQRGAEPGERGVVGGRGDAGGLLQSGGEGLEGYAGDGDDGHQPGRVYSQPSGHAPATGYSSFWSDFELIPCQDSKTRRIPTEPASAEPIFQFISDGLSGIMGPYWSLFVAQLKERLIHHASESRKRPREVLRALWQAYAQEAVWGNPGRHDAVQDAEVLLLAMCELAGHSQHEFEFSASDLGEVRTATMRIVRSQAESARSSQERGLAGSSSGESGDAVHSLPSGGGAQEGREVMHGLRREVPQAWHVSEALSAVEEVWRSAGDTKAKARDRERIRDGARLLAATSGFPLSGTLPNRVGILRGAGNAIVPQVAAEFIKAFEETLTALS